MVTRPARTARTTHGDRATGLSRADRARATREHLIATAIDVVRQRIGLSMRLSDEPGKPAQRAPRSGKRPQRGGAKPQAGGSMADALKKAGFGRR